MSILQEIEREIHRQIEMGFTAAHDDTHTNMELAYAASAYCGPVFKTEAGKTGGPPIQWPFEPEEYRPADQRRNLIRAAALIVAEIARLDRATAFQSPARSEA